LFENKLEQLGAGKQLNFCKSWRGQALSPGYIEGTACVVETLEEAGHLKMELGHDKILVIPSLNLGLSALLGNLGGLIVETGGLLAHSACQARERGIPAAVLPGATLQLKSGDRICLDGSMGLIRMA
jgi:pyruvate,water dikinase